LEDNPLLLRLKELESLERLVEKVGRIDLHAGDGQGLDALLTRLVRFRPAEPREPGRVAHGRPFIFPTTRSPGSSEGKPHCAAPGRSFCTVFITAPTIDSNDSAMKKPEVPRLRCVCRVAHALLALAQLRLQRLQAVLEQRQLVWKPSPP